MTTNDLNALCYLINPDVDWSGRDLSFINNLRLEVNASIDRQRMLDLIASDYWPKAVPDAMILTSDEDKKKRASSVIASCFESGLAGKKFLDFGCGDGSCTAAAILAGATSAVGFDLNKDQSWDNRQGVFTTDFAAVVDGAPYDAVLVYDVLDHMVGSDLANFQKLRELISPTGEIFVRCHPYTSRHGTHLYTSYNKAYAHLFMTADEITAVGGSQQPVYTNLNPKELYRALFTKMGYKSVRQKVSRIQPEAIIQAFLPTIANQWQPYKIVLDIDEIVEILAIQFVDYILQ